MTETIKKLIEKQRENIAQILNISIELISFTVDDNYVYYDYVSENDRKYHSMIKLDILSDMLRAENEVKYDIEEKSDNV